MRGVTRALGVLAGGWATLSCAAPPAATAPPPSSRPGGRADEAVPPADRDDGRAARVVADALASVAALRGLPVRGAVEARWVDRATMLAEVRAQIGLDPPRDVLRAQGVFLVAFGLAPVDFDLEQSFLSLLDDQLAGFYDPRRRVLFVAGDLAGDEARATLTHELVHALQDQHYELGPRLQWRPDGGDAQSAVHALAEGDATSAMFDELLAGSGRTALDLGDEFLAAQVRASVLSSPGSASVPAAIRRSVAAPYAEGTSFVHDLRRRGGWSAVDAAWRQPPVSTEQLLHPEKYRRGEPPLQVPAPPPPDPGLRELVRDVYGELSLRIAFEDWMPRRAALEAAEGWGGDRGVVYGDGDRWAAGWRVRMDTTEAATRAHLAFLRGALRSPARPAPSAADAAGVASLPVHCSERTTGPLAVARRGRDVVVLSGPFRASGSSIAAAARCADTLRWLEAVWRADPPA